MEQFSNHLLTQPERLIAEHCGLVVLGIIERKLANSNKDYLLQDLLNSSQELENFVGEIISSEEHLLMQDFFPNMWKEPSKTRKAKNEH